MPTPPLPYKPERDGYTFDPGYGVVSTRLDGGASRARRDVIGSAHTIEMSWLLKGYDYTILMGFFRDTLVEGTLPFLADLLTDVSVLTAHRAKCMAAKMPKLVKQSGDMYFVQGVMEVEANPTHTGILRFSFSPPKVDTLTVLMPEYLTGDKFRIVNSYVSGSTGPNYDGVYTVTSNTTTSVTDTGGAAVNPLWSSLVGSVDLSATITRVPT